ncbi:MAG: peptidoglycan DD-metalloendopeptidase family protein, partial [Porticoccaceae bacterium]
MKYALAPLLLVLLTLSPPGLGDEKEERSKLQAIREQISALSNKLLQRGSEVDGLAAELQKRELALAETGRSIANLDGDVTRLQSDMDALADQKDGLEDKRRAQQALITREVNAAYRQGGSEPVKLLLNQEDPQKAARIIKYYRYFADARREKIEEFAATLAELADVENHIEEKQQALLESRATLVAQRDALKKEQGERAAVLASLNAAIASDKARLDKLDAERKAVEEIIARLELAVGSLGDASEPFAKLRGKLPWPVSGKISQGFGAQRAQSLKWTGWLIDASQGTPVTAVHTGRVAFADYLRGQGLMMIIDHGGGYLTLYAHNQTLLKETGDWVRAGDRIALAGNSGGLANSALYFEIRHNGRPQDPKAWLS